MDMNAARQPLVVHAGENQELKVLGVGVSFLCETRHTGGMHSLMLNTVAEGAGPPPHWHDWDEGFYVISGEVEFTVGQDKVVGKPGSYVLAPGGVVHGFRGASSQPAQMLVFSVPGHAETFFTEVDRQVRGPNDRDLVLQIAEANGIHFVLN